MLECSIIKYKHQSLANINKWAAAAGLAVEKGMHIGCFCILMQLLIYNDHVIVQSLIVHPLCTAKKPGWISDITVVLLHRGNRCVFSQLKRDFAKWI